MGEENATTDNSADEGLPELGPPWEIGLEGRRRTVDEYRARWDVMPEKIEIVDGRLFWSQRERLALLAALLENVGLIEAVRLAPRDFWLVALDRAGV